MKKPHGVCMKYSTNKVKKKEEEHSDKAQTCQRNVVCSRHPSS
jgi:hypothetical protein